MDPTVPELSRLDAQLLGLLHGRPTAALATLDALGHPAVSMVPFALDAERAELILLVSHLAAHTAQLQARPRAALLVTDREDRADSVHALARVSLDVEASWPEPDSALAAQAASVYLARHPAAEMLTQLPDFRWVRLHLLQARHIAGFGAARSLDGDRVRTLIRDNPDQRRWI